MTHITSFKRILCLLLVCLVMTSAIITPVAASSLLYYAVAVAAENAISSLMRACGIYVSDGIENTLSEGLTAWNKLLDKLEASLPAEFKYTNAAMEVMVKMIFKDGLYYVDRNLVTYFLQCLTTGYNMTDDEGDFFIPVGYGFPEMEQWQIEQINAILNNCKTNGYYYETYTRKTPYCCFIDFVNGNSSYETPLVIFTYEEPTEAYYNANSGILFVNIPDGGYLLLNGSNGGQAVLADDEDTASVELRITTDGATVLNYTSEITVNTSDTFGDSVDSIAADTNGTAIDSTWDSTAVSITNPSTNATTTNLPLSVPSSTSAAATGSASNVTSGTYVDTTTEVIEEVATDTNTGTDTGTDTTTTTGFWSTLLSWVEKIWGVLSDILTYIKTMVTAIVQPIVNAIAAVRTQVIALVNYFTGTVTVASPLEALHLSAMFDLFPFNIPYGIYKAITFWGASPQAPIIKIPLPNYSGGAIGIYEYEINFSEIPGMDKLAAIIRGGELILFILGLALITRKVTKW